MGAYGRPMLGPNHPAYGHTPPPLPVARETRDCGHCGRPYQVTHHSQRYCNAVCGRNAVAARQRQAREDAQRAASRPEMVVMAGRTTDGDGVERYSLSQLLWAFAKAHQQTCTGCRLCSDLAWHVAREKARRGSEGGR